MEYLIFTKSEYDETWQLARAGDFIAAKRVILDQVKEGRETILALEVPFELELKVGEPGDEPKKLTKREVKKAIDIMEKETELETDPDKTE